MQKIPEEERPTTIDRPRIHLCALTPVTTGESASRDGLSHPWQVVLEEAGSRFDKQRCQPGQRIHQRSRRRATCLHGDRWCLRSATQKARSNNIIDWVLY